MAHDILLYVQPAYNCINGKMEYAEILIRRYRGMCGAETILKFVERNNLTEMFDLDVFDEALRIVTNKLDKLECPLGINLCPATIEIPGIVDKLKAIADKHHVDVHSLVIEINEGTDFNDATYENICQLHKLGVAVALDDFGIERANLYSIMKYEFDILKVDKCFIGHEKEESKTKLLELIQTLCSAFHMKPIVEGIETKKQLNNISKLGYKVVQGYFYTKPVPFKEYAEGL